MGISFIDGKGVIASLYGSFKAMQILRPVKGGVAAKGGGGGSGAAERLFMAFPKIVIIMTFSAGLPEGSENPYLLQAASPLCLCPW